MFCTNTKIVVTGTNVDRKAGPRIGSLGYISHIDTPNRFNINKNIYIQAARIIFIRYGYEKKKRFETINVYLVSPKSRLSNNKRKVINKCINITKNIKKANRVPYICVSPVDEDLTNDYELIAKVVSKLHTSEFFNLIKLLSNPNRDKEYCANEGLHNIENIYNILPDSTLKFLNEYNKPIKSTETKKLILKHYKNNEKSIKELFMFINMCVVLADKTNKKYSNKANPWYNAEYDFDNLTDKLFKIFEFNYRLRGATKQKNVLEHFNNLTTEIKRRGNIVINKH